MPGSHPVRWIIFLCGALAAFGCANTDTDQGATGSLSLDLVLADDIQIDVVDWEITGNGMDMGGSVDVSAPGSTASIEVFGLPVGEEPYLVELSAVSVDQQVTCRGSAEFDIEVGVSMPVMVILRCKLPQELGSVRVNGKFNICAQLTKATAAPLQTSVGNDIDLTSQAEDAEGDPIAFNWAAASGSIDDASAASTTYTCTEAGDHTITISVTDNDDYCDMATWTFPITCVPGEAECQSDADCGAGELCVAGRCVPDIECNEDSDCDAGEICVDNECVPDVECILDSDCDMGEVCVDNACVPEVECTIDDDCGTGEVCVANECVPDVECIIDDDCPMGEVCVANECVPDVECAIDDDCPMGEVCVANECVPDVECTIDDDCPMGEVCVANECVLDVECTIDDDCPMGEVCVANECVPDVECNIDDDCGMDEVCVANACVSDPDLFCDVDVCATDDAARAACVETFLVCLAAEPANEEECILLALTECDEEVVYAQDFEPPMDPAAGDALILDTAAEVPLGPWLVFANVFDGGGAFKFPYGPFGAPNAAVSPSTTFISAVVTGEGDVPQGDQQLSVFSDYNCCDPNVITGELQQGHGNGTDRVQINVFQELNPIPASFIGQNVVFSFDVKRGNIEGASTALAFITTLDPSTGFSQTNFVPFELTNVAAVWSRASITLDLTDPALEGQILQVGFRNTAQNFEGSGIFYDNVLVTLQ